MEGVVTKRDGCDKGKVSSPGSLFPKTGWSRFRVEERTLHTAVIIALMVKQTEGPQSRECFEPGSFGGESGNHYMSVLAKRDSTTHISVGASDQEHAIRQYRLLTGNCLRRAVRSGAESAML